MRSSPRFLVASRSGENDGPSEDNSGLEGPKVSPVVHRSEHPRPDDGAEVTVHLKVGYKTVLLVVVVFDFIHLSLRELVNSSFVEQLLVGLGVSLS